MVLPLVDPESRLSGGRIVIGLLLAGDRLISQSAQGESVPAGEF